MALNFDGDGNAKRLHADEEGNQGDRISEMVDDLKLKILTHLPLKDAIRMVVLSKEWSRVWKLRLNQDVGGAHIHHDLVPRIYPSSEQLLELLQRRRGRRLQSFSLVVKTSELHVELRNTSARNRITFHFPMRSRNLARLSLRGINLSQRHYMSPQNISKLEVIRLYEVGIVDKVLLKMVPLYAALRTLDLCYCHGLSDLRRVFHGRNLRTLTVDECAGVRELNVQPVLKPVCSIRSFRYSGSFIWPFYLPRAAAFTDLYICYNVAIPVDVSGQWFDNTLFNTSELTVLTICSNVLQAVSSLTDAGVHAGLAKVANFQKLKELQLIMFEMKALNLAGIYAFLKNCQCPTLESLFVQLPTEKSYMPVVDANNGVIEEPPEDVLENLKVVKIMNFSCDLIAVQLVLFFLRKANSLRELLLVAPNINQLNVSDIPDIQQADRLLLNEALANGKLVLKPDNTTPCPLHSEVFAEL
ncbi:hypothetical protein BRADI_1g43060v3 [Brachypodium distachyon]|uniref:F-box domain-containing protein n=1 Tax=Brachypodium distachyon TaxID=15368 RepID=A0A0Q3JLI8_BRADI|nr:hypothetical protein BRADI_1g43060v3 [Brachypodium distachyon]